MTQLQSPSSSTGGSGGTKVIAVSVALAVVAVIIVQVYIAMIRAQVAEQSITVYQLTRSVSPGDVLDVEDDVRAIQIPARLRDNIDHLHAIFTDGLAARDGASFRNAAPMNALLTYDLFAEGEGQRIGGKVAEGRRLFALRVKSDEQPGNLLPEMLVDIGAPFPTDDGKIATEFVLENVRVVTVGTYYRTEGEGAGRTSVRGYRSITIEIPAVDVLAMSNLDRLCSPLGPFELYIRNPNDTAPLFDRGTNAGRINPRVVRLVKDRFDFDLYGPSPAGSVGPSRVSSRENVFSD